LETNGPASATNRFFTSWAWQFRVQDRRLRVVPHPRRADFVDDAADRLEAVIQFTRRHRGERRAAHLVDDLAEGLLHVLRLFHLGIREPRVEPQDGDAVGIDDAGVDLAVGVVVRIISPRPAKFTVAP